MGKNHRSRDVLSASMAEHEFGRHFWPMAKLFRLSDFQAKNKKRRCVYFNRLELNQLLSI